MSNVKKLILALVVVAADPMSSVVAGLPEIHSVAKLGHRYLRSEATVAQDTNTVPTYLRSGHGDLLEQLGIEPDEKQYHRSLGHHWVRLSRIGGPQSIDEGTRGRWWTSMRTSWPPVNVEVNYGDGVIEKFSSSDFYYRNFYHTYRDNGDYVLTVWAGKYYFSDSKSLTVSVNNVPPTIDCDGLSTTLAGQTLWITVPIWDPGLDDDHAARIDWGDGGISDGTVTSPDFHGNRQVSASHFYPIAGTYNVALMVEDINDSSSVSSVCHRLVTINTCPQVFAGVDATVNEGSVFSQDGYFVDPDLGDTWTAAADYSDGTVEDLSLNPNKSFTLAHTYGDSGPYTVVVTVTDGSGCIGTDTIDINSLNVAPVVTCQGPSTTEPIGVNEIIHVTGTISDPGFDDTHIATWRWGDGTETPISPMQSTSVDGTHAYTAPGTYNIELLVQDDDGDVTMQTCLTVTVNTCPVLTYSSLITPSIDEGSDFSWQGLFSDPDSDDSWTVKIIYGDGNEEEELHTESGNTFSFIHTYVDEGHYDGTISVEDRWECVHSLQFEVDVINVPPSFCAETDFLDPISVGVPMTVEEAFFDPGVLDTHTATWNWGDGQSNAGTVTKTVGHQEGTVSGSHTYDSSGQYTVSLTMHDEDGGTSTKVCQEIYVNTPPEAHAGGPYEANEGSPVELDGTGSSDEDGHALSYSWSIETSDPSTTCEFDHSTIARPKLTCLDNTVAEVKLTVADSWSFNDATAIVTVCNVAPNVSEILFASGPLVPVSDPVQVSTEFTDPGLLDIHNAIWRWGDETEDTCQSDAIGSDECNIVSLPSSNNGSVTGMHRYIDPGVYRIELAISDDDWDSATEIFEYAVVYDASGGFVTGGGWIYSPAKAYVDDEMLEGKAKFGFVSKYNKGSQAPSGKTEFQFQSAGLNFHSSSYDWLVVAGKKAMFKGTGSVNGSHGYGFLLSAIDGDSSKVEKDKFRIKIWVQQSDSLVYDNQIDAAENTDPTTEIGGGSIIVHNPEK